MQHPDYPIWTLVGLILVILPAPWHIKAGNIATIALIGWLALANLCFFINTVAWSGSYADQAPIWCDISGRVLLAMGYAIPACSFSQMRRLESVASTRRSFLSSRDRTKRKVEEICLCICFPIVMVAIHYLVQGYRYDVLENYGCNINYYSSWPGVFVRYIIPMALSGASLIFAGLAIRWFIIRRLEFRAVLSASSSGLTVDRYLRLIALAVTDVTVLAVIDILVMATTFRNDNNNSASKLNGDVRLSTIHFNYLQISQIPEDIMSATHSTSLVLSLYMTPLYSIVFFIFFGFGEEAISEYVSCWRFLKGCIQRPLTHFRRPTFTEITPTLGSKVIPSFTPDIVSSTAIHGSGWTSNKEVHNDAILRGSERGVAMTVEKLVV